MRNMEFLTEKDLEYFRKKEEKGEAIIIRIDPDTLMQMDLDAVFADIPRDQTLSPRELEDLLSRQGLAKARKEPRTEEDEKPAQGQESSDHAAEQSADTKKGSAGVGEAFAMTTDAPAKAADLLADAENYLPMDALEERMVGAALSDAAMELVTKAIAAGFNDAELMLLLKNSSSYQDMQDTFSLLEGMRRF